MGFNSQIMDVTLNGQRAVMLSQKTEFSDVLGAKLVSLGADLVCMYLPGRGEPGAMSVTPDTDILIVCLDGIAADSSAEGQLISLDELQHLLGSTAGLMAGRNSSGRILCISSILSGFGQAGWGRSAAWHAGLSGMIRCLALEYASGGVLINVLAPGYVQGGALGTSDSGDMGGLTARIPLRRLARSEEIAQAVGFLCSGLNTFMTGQTVYIDGGYTVQ